MNTKTFYYSPSFKPFSVLDSFSGTFYEKKLLKKILVEWNSHISLSSMCSNWKKERPVQQHQNLLFLIYNVEGLSTHITDIDILINKYQPHIFLLSGVGAAVKKPPSFPGYLSFLQAGGNSYGGVAIYYNKTIKCQVIERDNNFLMIEISVMDTRLNVGVIYIPPIASLPLHLLSKYKDKSFVICGDYNAKHSLWNCPNNNPKGNELFNWIEHVGVDVIAPSKATSRKSEAVIYFGITNDASGWQAETLDEGTSDHKPVLIQSPYCIDGGSYFRKTNWKVFSFFLIVVFEYWNTLVYNFDINSFIELFSLFLTALWDRCSTYEHVNRYRPPWPPYLVSLAREVNKCRRRYRRSRRPIHLEIFLSTRNIFVYERYRFLQQQHENKMIWVEEKQNIWKYVKPIFHAYTPPFRGLTVDNGVKEKRPDEIVRLLADYYEKHFSVPVHDVSNTEHILLVTTYEEVALLPNFPLDKIKYEEVLKEWKKIRPKKSTDSASTSAFLLKKLPIQYISTITILFNQCAEKGEFFKMSKHAKVVCLSKEGLFPTVNKLRPISLLPNIGKWFERIVHNRIIEWCRRNNIYTDEQSGFTAERRLQTRILSLVEDLRMTVAANNRPALVLFVDFLSAFDNMWYPSLIRNLKILGLPIPLLKWIYNWLQERTITIQFGEVHSRTISMGVGAPQGSVLAATLFRLHVHFLPSYFFSMTSHMFADDLAIEIMGDLEKRFSLNIIELERRVKSVLERIGVFADNNILPININKTKALLVHNIVAPTKPKIEFRGQQIEVVKNFKYLGVTISTKLGWGNFISERIQKIRKVYRGMNIIFHSIPKEKISMRKRIFSAFAMPHFIWLFPIWFFFTDKQQRHIEHVYCSGIRCVFSLAKWEDETILILSKEKSLLDYLYSYWCRFTIHLAQSPDALCFQQSWRAYNIVKSLDQMWYKNIGFNRRNRFLARLKQNIKHSLNDWNNFEIIHKHQINYYKTNTKLLNLFIYKYFLCSCEN